MTERFVCRDVPILARTSAAIFRLRLCFFLFFGFHQCHRSSCPVGECRLIHVEGGDVKDFFSFFIPGCLRRPGLWIRRLPGARWSRPAGASIPGCLTAPRVMDTAPSRRAVVAPCGRVNPRVPNGAPGYGYGAFQARCGRAQRARQSRGAFGALCMRVTLMTDEIGRAHV